MRIHASLAVLFRSRIEPDTSDSTPSLAPAEADGTSASAIAHGSARVNSTADASTFISTRVCDRGVTQSTPAMTAAHSATAIAQRVSWFVVAGIAVSRVEYAWIRSIRSSGLVGVLF